jgi:hypothetical protein
VTDPTGALHPLTTQPDGLLTAYADPKHQACPVPDSLTEGV